MGEVFAGPGFRTCSRSACRWPAVATLAFDYVARQAWLEDLRAQHEPATYDLCSVHAQRFRPPNGWGAEDRRRMAEPLFKVPSVAAAPGQPPGEEIAFPDAVAAAGGETSSPLQTGLPDF